MLKKSPLFLCLFLATLVSCTYIAEKLDGDASPTVIGLKQSKFVIVFSGNISGETHPCGCRHFPLGGLPQVAGAMAELKKDADLLYVDAGDMLFPATNLPQSVMKSLTFASDNLIKGQEMMGLSWFVPGDQDFANGLTYFKTVAEKARFQVLLANLNVPETFKHKRWSMLEKGPHKIYLTGLIHPETMSPDHQSLFAPVETAMQTVLDEMKKDGYDPTNNFHRLVLISHAGIDNDQELAKKFPMIDWIIGSHSQSFTTLPVMEGNTKMIQTLSKNHYLGHVTFDLTSDKTKDEYAITEVRDELQAKLSPNPFIEFIANHKTEMEKLQQAEQNEFFKYEGTKAKHLPTAASCIECHDTQVKHWQGTAHSIAYWTLMHAKEPQNLQCIKCHSLGQGDVRGFIKAVDLVRLDPEKAKVEDQEKLKLAYWAEIEKMFKKVDSVRKLSSAEQKKYSDLWLAKDKEKNITHNFANVQCLNCHQTSAEHPFVPMEKEFTKEEKQAYIKGKCLECHTADQSPEWYGKDSRGLAGKLDEDKFSGFYKKIACPSAQ